MATKDSEKTPRPDQVHRLITHLKACHAALKASSGRMSDKQYSRATTLYTAACRASTAAEIREANWRFENFLK